MLDRERVIAVIPARGGSKAVPRKNLAPLGGKPLVVWSIELALSVDAIDRVIVSTDDETIAGLAEECGAEVYVRPADLATDDALVIDVVVLLEPTCPFRSAEDVNECLRGVVVAGKDSVATFKAADLNPHRAWTLADGSPRVFLPGANPWLPRQQLPAAYQLNGAVYCFRADLMPPTERGLLYGNAGAVVMPADRSVDINTATDLLLAELILSRGRRPSGNR
jgi:N-acylneuraminate cytidylyltransferase